MVRIIGFIIVCMLGLTPAYAANICDPADARNCVGTNTTATGGGWHTSSYGPSSYDANGKYIWQKATYSAGFALSALPTTAQPFFILCGSNTKAVYIQKFNLNGSEATAAVRRTIILRKTLRPTAVVASSGPTSWDAVPWDTLFGDSTIDALYIFTTATTSFSRAPQASVIIGTQTTTFPLTGTPAVTDSIQELEWDFTGNERSGVVLRGSSQCLEAQFGVLGANAPTVAFSVQWAEVQEK